MTEISPGFFRQERNIGIAVIIATVFAMSLADAIVKYASAGFPLWQIYVVRSVIAIPAIVAILAFQRNAPSPRPRAPSWTLLRALLLALMYIAIYAAIPVLSLSVLAAALYTGPLFIALFSALLIGEPVRGRQWLAIAIGFLGVLIILRPNTDDFSPAMLIPIIAAILYALAAVITRSKCAEEHPMVLALSLNYALLAVGLLATGALVLWGPSTESGETYPFLLGRWTPMGGGDWGLLAILAGLIVAIGVGLALAYQSAPPSVIAAFDYTYLIFAAIWGYAFFADIPDPPTVLGMAMIAWAGMLTIRQPETDPCHA